MNDTFHPNLRKLITAFLVLSTFVTSGTLFFASFSLTRSSPEETATTERSGLTEGQNVFVEPIPNDPLGDATPLDLPPPVYTSNLTENLIQGVARGLIITNPTGPQYLEDGSAITTPTKEELNKLIDQEIARAPLKELAIEKNTTEINVVADYKPEDPSLYFKTVREILSETVAGEQYKRFSSLEPSFEALNATEVLYREAIQKLKDLRVPEPLAGIHRTLVAALVSQKKSFEIIANYEIDPVKTLALTKTGNAVLQTNAEAVYAEIEKFIAAHTEKPSSTSKTSSPFSSFFIKKAEAAIGVPIILSATVDPKTLEYQVVENVNSTGTWQQQLLEWLKKLATEILKNQIVHRLVEQIVNWVQGEGKPQFVTNWREFLADAAQGSAAFAISSVYPKLCSSFRPLVNIALQPTPYIGPLAPTCTLDQIKGGLRSFYNDFQTGGWLAYGAALDPSSNLFGSIIQTRDIALIEAIKAKEASKSEAESSDGFLSIKVCDNNKPPKKGVCADGSTPVDTTPGGLVAKITSENVGSSVKDYVVNAQDLEALISALIDSFLNKMIIAGVNGLLGTRPDSSSRTGNNCDGLTGQAYTDCVNSLNVKVPPPTYPSIVPPPPPPNTTSTTPATCTNTATPPCVDLTPGTPEHTQCIAACYPT